MCILAYEFESTERDNTVQRQRSSRTEGRNISAHELRDHIQASMQSCTASSQVDSGVSRCLRSMNKSGLLADTSLRFSEPELISLVLQDRHTH